MSWTSRGYIQAQQPAAYIQLSGGGGRVASSWPWQWCTEQLTESATAGGLCPGLLSAQLAQQIGLQPGCNKRSAVTGRAAAITADLRSLPSVGLGSSLRWDHLIGNCLRKQTKSGTSIVVLIDMIMQRHLHRCWFLLVTQLTISGVKGKFTTQLEGDRFSALSRRLAVCCIWL